MLQNGDQNIFKNQVLFIHQNISQRHFANFGKGLYPNSKCWEKATSISPYSVQMRENADQNNSEYEHFSRSDKLSNKTLSQGLCAIKSL